MITRSLVRDDVHAAVLELVLKGSLQPGSRINEVHLASQLGVSRTPVREALFRLTQSGFLRAAPSRGFIVQPLTLQEAQDVYPILWTLEGFALRLAYEAGGIDLPELERLNQARFEVHEESSRSHALDLQWHDVLLRACPNALLLTSIMHFKQIVHRYEYAFAVDPDRVIAASEQHREILRALASHDIELAVTLLAEHWRLSQTVTFSWINGS
jgi:DNA-binding GntR family transcriptional regulator